MTLNGTAYKHTDIENAAAHLHGMLEARKWHGSWS